MTPSLTDVGELRLLISQISRALIETVCFDWEIDYICFLSIFHTLAKDMFLNRGATHFTLGLRPCIISSFLLQIYLPPPLKITQLRHCARECSVA